VCCAVCAVCVRVWRRSQSGSTAPVPPNLAPIWPAARIQAPTVERFIIVPSIIEMGFYNNFARSVWGKSNANYLTYIVAGCIGLEFFYGSFVNYVWEKNNKGVSG
jgi:hypothetical protein